jgi:hypothetical protein
MLFMGLILLILTRLVASTLRCSEGGQFSGLIMGNGTDNIAAKLYSLFCASRVLPPAESYFILHMLRFDWHFVFIERFIIAAGKVQQTGCWALGCSTSILFLVFHTG